MARFASPPTHAQKVAIAICPKFSAFLSICGSAFIIAEIMQSGKNKLKLAYHRILLGMSIIDLIASFGFFLTTWPVPAPSDVVWGAAGNRKTCTMQGFFIQMGVSTIMYNGALAMYYLVMIRYGWKEERIKKWEPLMHFLVLGWGLGTCFTGVALDLFNNSLFNCWIATYPGACKESWKNNGVTTCTRGDNASLYQWIFYYVPVWTVMGMIGFSMFLVYRSVRDKERSMERYLPTASQDGKKERKYSARVARQGMWYVGSVYATFLFPSVTRITSWLTGIVYYELLLLLAIFLPIQGFFNCVVYLRPRYIRYKDKNPEMSTFKLVKATLGTTLGCLANRKDERFGTDVDTVNSKNHKTQDSVGGGSPSPPKEDSVGEAEEL